MSEILVLNGLYNLYGSKKRKKRVGRGIGSGVGKTCKRGVKGQKARKGVAIKGFEGGQMPLIKRLPKRGFKSLNKEIFTLISVDLLNFMIEEGHIKKDSVVNKEFLHSFGLIKTVSETVKILGSKDILTSLKFDLDAYSEKVKANIAKSGGQIL